MPFKDPRTGKEYVDFADCTKQNQWADSPEGYCAFCHKEAIGKYPSQNATGLNQHYHTEALLQAARMEDKMPQQATKQKAQTEDKSRVMEYMQKLIEEDKNFEEIVELVGKNYPKVSGDKVVEWIAGLQVREVAEFRAGDRVRHKTTGKEGKVNYVDRGKDYYPIEVEWDDGEEKKYEDHELELVTGAKEEADEDFTEEEIREGQRVAPARFGYEIKQLQDEGKSVEQIAEELNLAEWALKEYLGEEATKETATETQEENYRDIRYTKEYQDDGKVVTTIYWDDGTTTENYEIYDDEEADMWAQSEIEKYVGDLDNSMDYVSGSKAEREVMTKIENAQVPKNVIQRKRDGVYCLYDGEGEKVYENEDIEEVKREAETRGVSYRVI